MKRRSLLIIGALAFSSIIGLTSCNNESPIIDKVTVVRKGKVRRAKLNYLRDMTKQPKIKERN